MAVNLVYLLILLIVCAIVLYCARLLIDAFAVPQPFATLIYVCVILIALLIILQSVGAFGHFGTVTIR